jgi:hypothetical protein
MQRLRQKDCGSFLEWDLRSAERFSRNVKRRYKSFARQGKSFWGD